MYLKYYSCTNISRKSIIEIAVEFLAANAPSVPLVEHMMTGLRFSLPPLADSQKAHTQTHTPSTITDLPSKLAGFAGTVAVGFLLNLRNPLQMVDCTVHDGIMFTRSNKKHQHELFQWK